MLGGGARPWLDPPTGSKRFQSVSGMVLPRFAGIATFMRLPGFDPAEAGRSTSGLFGIPFGRRPWDAVRP